MQAQPSSIERNNPEDSSIQRKGFGLRREILPILAENYKSELIDQVRKDDYSLTVGNLTFKIAKEFGFCYGVDKAIDFAYETRMKFPDRKIYITSEIIHNPLVNRKLIEMGIQFLSGQYKGDKGVEEIEEEDIVLLPAFGTTVEELEYLKNKKCLLIDTTCNSVVAVWKRVEQYAQEGYTAIVHGKYNHEETKATCSRASKYLIVLDKREAQVVCNYISYGGRRNLFLKQFAGAFSSGFDPDRDLERVGCANQTTMMKNESLEIANMIQDAMIEKYGKEALSNHFRHFDTICSATQERQDAIFHLLDEEKIDLMIVIGGYNSSNTTHLAEIASSHKVPTFHVKGPECFLSPDTIEHKPVSSHTPTVTSPWLPRGKVTIGISAGASTPNKVIEEVIQKICTLTNPV